MSIFLAWRHLVRWLRTLILKLSRKQPVNWTDEIDELTEITNEALDAQGYPMPDQKPKPSPTAAPSPDQVPDQVPEKTRRFHGRLIEWLRRKNSEHRNNEEK